MHWWRDGWALSTGSGTWHIFINYGGGSNVIVISDNTPSDLTTFLWIYSWILLFDDSPHIKSLISSWCWEPNILKCLSLCQREGESLSWRQAGGANEESKCSWIIISACISLRNLSPTPHDLPPPSYIIISSREAASCVSYFSLNFFQPIISAQSYVLYHEQLLHTNSQSPLPSTSQK